MKTLRIVVTCEEQLLVAHRLGDVEVFERIVDGLLETLPVPRKR